jgi:hypothetical protein
MYRIHTLKRNLSFSVALSAMKQIAHSLNLQKVLPMVYLNNKFRVEVLKDDEGYVLLVERYEEVQSNSIESLVEELKFKRLSKEMFGVDVTYQRN